MADRTVDVTELVDHLQLMIRIADRMAETQPFPASIKKLRDAADRVARKARDILARGQDDV